MSLCINKLVVGPVRTNCYIVNEDGKEEAVIIDPGDEAEVIQRKITALRLKPMGILLTHGHFDHVSAVKKLREHYGIKVYALEEEREILTSDKNLGMAFCGVRIRMEADEYLRDKCSIELAGIKFHVIHTPGHTIGSCCYYVEKEKTLFSGDTLFCSSHGRTDFPTGSQSAIIRSIVNKLLVLDEDTKVYPGHEEETTIGSEKVFYDLY